MVRVGIAGIGFMGWIHYLAYKRLPNAQVTAICTRDEKKLAGDWRGIQGNFGPPGEQVDLGDIGRYKQLDDLLADETVDLVDLCLPPDLHCEAAVKCLQAGKHVLVEKPIALKPAEADRMMQAAQDSGKQLLVAHVLPFFPEFQFVYRALDSQTYGAFRGGIFKRIISEPTWIPDFFDPDKVGGPVVDLHIHDAHFIRLLCGMPRGVFSSGRMRGEVVEFLTTQFLFDDPDLEVAAISGVIPQQGRPFTHAFEVHFDRATIIYDSAALVDQVDGLGIPLTVLTEDGRTERPDLGPADPIVSFEQELGEAVAAIEENRPSPLLGGLLARDALAICHQETESVRSGQMVAVL